MAEALEDLFFLPGLALWLAVDPAAGEPAADEEADAEGEAGADGTALGPQPVK